MVMQSPQPPVYSMSVSVPPALAESLSAVANTPSNWCRSLWWRGHTHKKFVLQATKFFPIVTKGVNSFKSTGQLFDC